MIWLILIIVLTILVVKCIRKQQYKKLETEVLNKLGFKNWHVVSYFDAYITVKSRQTLGNYDDIKFFKENKEMLNRAEETLKLKNNMVATLQKFLENNEYKFYSQYD